MEYKLGDFVDRAELDRFMHSRIREEDDVVTGSEGEMGWMHLKEGQDVYGAPVIESAKKTKLLSRLKKKFDTAKTRIQVTK